MQKRKKYYIHEQKKKKKSIKGWHNIDKLYVENKSKQITCIQKSRTECLKGIVYIGCRRKYIIIRPLILSFNFMLVIEKLIFAFFLLGFRYANYFIKNNTLHRTLFKAYGIRFVILVYGEVTDYIL